MFYFKLFAESRVYKTRSDVVRGKNIITHELCKRNVTSYVRKGNSHTRDITRK